MALQAEHAPLGYLSCVDLVHDVALSTQSADEVVGELAARVVYGLDFPPVRRYLVCGISRIARDQFPNRGKREVELAQHRYKARRFELPDVVIAISRDFIDVRWHEYMTFVVETERLNRQTRPPCELADTDFFHASPFLVIGPESPTHRLCGLPQGESQAHRPAWFRDRSDGTSRQADLEGRGFKSLTASKY